VLTLSDGLKVIYALTPSDAGQYCSFFILPVLRNYDCDRLTNGLFGSVTKDTLGT
jgi:hypothetical protein